MATQREVNKMETYERPGADVSKWTVIEDAQSIYVVEDVGDTTERQLQAMWDTEDGDESYADWCRDHRGPGGFDGGIDHDTAEALESRGADRWYIR